MDANAATEEVADRLVVSYRAADADADTVDTDEESGFAEDHIVHERIREPPFRMYLRRVHDGPVAVGDEWTEFVNCGCGTTADVVLRVEAVVGGDRLGGGTAVELRSIDEVYTVVHT